MKVWQLLDATPGGYQDRLPLVKWLVRHCAVVPANVWTSSRLPGGMLVIVSDWYSTWLALVVFAAIALTDWLDGKVARYRGESETNGVWLDPLMDKIFVLLCFGWFGWKTGLLSAQLFWLLVGVVIALRLIAYIVSKLLGRPFEIKAKFYGKMKFTGQIALGGLLLLANCLPWFLWFWVLNFILVLIIILALVSIVGHLVRLPEPFK